MATNFLTQDPDNKSIKELLVELKDLNQTIKESNIETRRVSKVFVVLALIQIVVALWQLIFEVQTSEFRWIGIITLFCLAASLLWIFKKARI